MRNTLTALILLIPLAVGMLLDGAAGGSPRTLLLCIDGVNFSDFEFLQRRGHFQYLGRPARLIAPFPSLTNPSMVEILQPAGASPSPGYEDSFFDLGANRMRGGILKRLGPGFVRGSFRELFDFHPPGFQSGFEYLAPPYSCEGMFSVDLEEGLRRFRKAKQRVFRIYIGPTDCASHTGGLNSARGLLIQLDRRLRRALDEEPDLRLALFSDHGNAYGAYRRVDLAAVLKRNGFRPAKRIRRVDDAVVPSFGLIGAAVVFVDDSRAKAAAIGLSLAEGVHLSAVKKNGVVHLFSGGEEGRIIRSGERLVYSPGPQDPLRLGEGAAMTPDQWFESTRSHRYPDPVNRLWEQSDRSVVNRAPVLVSFKRGYYAGSRVLDIFVELRATHGSLDAEQSLGFLAASGNDLPDFLQTRQAGAQLRRIGF